MDLSLPPIFLLPFRLGEDERIHLEEQIPSLTYDIREASIVLGKITTAQRAKYELQHRNVFTRPAPVDRDGGPGNTYEEPTPKRRRRSSEDIHTSRTVPAASEIAVLPNDSHTTGHDSTKSKAVDRRVRVVRLEWFADSRKAGKLLPIVEYLIYEGQVVQPGSLFEPRPQTPGAVDTDILTRAIADGTNSPRSKFDGRNYADRPSKATHHPALIHQTSSEKDAATRLPELPAFMSTPYSCQRPTPAQPPNEDFIELLRKVRTTRRLQGDEIGVRAYSTAIASIAAYPCVITMALDVERLHGCGNKFAQLYQEWNSTGTLGEVEMAKSSPELTALALFYDIWGVGDATAREFYKKGWRDLDDVVEHGWNTLSRVQQIGVKYYDEFLRPIPRAEVEHIAKTILQHARKIDPGFQLTIVGGYRRGKKGSGDVDVVVSHPEESATQHFIGRLVVSLEETGHITHTLSLSLQNSEREQRPVSWKGNAGKGTGFDTLDKALVVWKEPGPADTNPEGFDLAGDEALPGNKTPHRRVDIIVSPWRTVGCALLGWSGGTTFQRDLRRYCKNVKALKFDSSGIRSRTDGSWVDMEGGERGPAPDMAEAERRVFAGLGLEWRPPEERCTG